MIKCNCKGGEQKMDDNLISMGKLQSDIKTMKLVSLFLKPEQRKQLNALEKQLDNMNQEISDNIEILSRKQEELSSLSDQKVQMLLSRKVE